MTKKSDFYVNVSLLDNGLFRHNFFYATDLRFHKDIPCVDASAITAWCDGKSYNRIHMQWSADNEVF